jgi:hypothetical protein
MKLIILFYNYFLCTILYFNVIFNHRLHHFMGTWSLSLHSNTFPMSYYQLDEFSICILMHRFSFKSHWTTWFYDSLIALGKLMADLKNKPKIQKIHQTTIREFIHSINNARKIPKNQSGLDLNNHYSPPT